MNLFTPNITITKKSEHFTPILEHKNVTIEQILSNHVKDGKWMQQEEDEWVLLLQGEACLKYENASSISLTQGQYLFIPSKTKHAVESTSGNAIWLAIHIA